MPTETDCEADIPLTADQIDIMQRAELALETSGITGKAGTDKHDASRLGNCLANLMVYANYYGLDWDYAVNYAKFHSRCESVKKGDSRESQGGGQDDPQNPF